MIVNVDDAAVSISRPEQTDALSIVTNLELLVAARALIADGIAVEVAADDACVPSHAWLRIADVRERAVSALAVVDPAWEQAWVSMIAFANEHGWVRDGAFVRAHIQRVG